MAGGHDEQTAGNAPLALALITGVALTGAAMAQETLGVGVAVPGGFDISGPVPLYLEVFVNGRSTELIAEFSYDAVSGRMSSPRSELIEVGVDPGFGLSGDVALDSIAGLTYVYDETRQVLDLTLDPEARRAEIISANRVPEPLTADPTWGGVLNYSASVGATQREDGTPGFDRFSLSTNAWLFSPLGTLSNTAVFTYLPDGTDDFLRYETRYDFSAPSRAMTFSVGDIVTSSLRWSRPIRMGGAQVRREFGLRSDIVTEPLLSFGGAAAVPSTVDVFIDNNRVYSGRIDEGPYQFEDIPIYSGAGDALVVIQDENGDVQTREVAFFASQNLLKPGVADWSVETGYAREGYGIESNGYGEELLYSGSLRYGVTNRLTVEAHVEGSDDLFLYGVGVNTVIANRVELSFSGGQSTFDDLTAAFGYGAVRTSFWGADLEASSLRAEEGFTDLAHTTAPGMTDVAGMQASLLEFPTALDVVSVSLPTDSAGQALGMSYVRSTRGETTDEIVSMNYTRGLEWRDASMNLSGAYDLQTDDTRISALLTVQFGTASAQFSTQQDTFQGDGGSFTYYQPLGEAIGDVGYGASFDFGDRQDVLAAAVQARTRYGAGEVSTRLSDGGIALQGRFDGAIVTTGGRLALGNTVNDAFAIVDVGVSDVPVYLQNREIAITGSNGQALVPGLGSYANNRLSINPHELPLDITVASTATDVVPALRSGVIVDMGGASTGAAAVMALRLAGGNYVPPGSVARLTSTGEEFVVGYDGQIYVTNLGSSNTLEVTMPQGTCTARIGAPAGGAVQNDLGVVTCG